MCARLVVVVFECVIFFSSLFAVHSNLFRCSAHNFFSLLFVHFYLVVLHLVACYLPFFHMLTTSNTRAHSFSFDGYLLLLHIICNSFFTAFHVCS